MGFRTERVRRRSEVLDWELAVVCSSQERQHDRNHFRHRRSRAEGKDATFEVGKFAPLAGGSITARMGDTVVLVTATGAKAPAMVPISSR